MYDPTGKTVVTKRDIVAGLRQIGLQQDDLVQVHTSLSAFGYIEGGADTVLDALLEVVGPEGTVMTPTFNHGSAKVFDIKTTPSTNGAVTEALRKRPEARRSMHPTHPYGAIGYLADRLVEGHLEAGTFSHNCPLGKLAIWGGYVLLLGVGMNTNTAFHMGETMAHCPCIAPKLEPRKIVDAFGNVVQVWGDTFRRHGPCLVERAIEGHMRNRGQIKDSKIGDAEIHLMRAADVIGGAFFLAQTLCAQCATAVNQPQPEE